MSALAAVFSCVGWIITVQLSVPHSLSLQNRVAAARKSAGSASGSETSERTVLQGSSRKACSSALQVSSEREWLKTKGPQPSGRESPLKRRSALGYALGRWVGRGG